MKILFIYTNINGFHEDTYSFGLASIISVAKLNGHESKAIIVHTKSDYAKVLKEIELFKPQVVGFTSVSSQFSFVKELAEIIKLNFPNIVLVCGGIHPTINPQCILESIHLDAIFVGESEYSFVELLERVEHGRSYRDVDNLAYNDNGTLVINKLKPLAANLDSLPYPDKEIYPFEETLKTMGYAPFLFSKGCPYLCTYCSNHAIAKRYNLPRNTHRYRSAESSISEIEATIKKYPITKILICDDLFGLDRKWLEEFCEKYKKRVGIKFQCLLRANVVDENIIRRLKEAGCFRISFGIESGNGHIRNTIMNRQMTEEQIINAFGLAHKYGLETTALNIIGVPGESEKMIWDTIKLNRKIKPTDSGINIFYPYKGTKLGDYCFEQGLVNEDLYYSFSNERRETILKYPEKHRKKLKYFREHWDRLVYGPFSKKYMKKSFHKMFGAIKRLKVLTCMLEAI